MCNDAFCATFPFNARPQEKIQLGLFVVLLADQLYPAEIFKLNLEGRNMAWHLSIAV